MRANEVVTGQKIQRQKLERARQLRGAMTAEEKALWDALRCHVLGVHFRRQQIIAGFIVDFYCHSRALVIELDGGVHKRGEERRADLARDRVLGEMGLRVVRFTNEAVMKDLDRVLDRIRELIRI